MDMNVKHVNLPKKEHICERCYYTNGNLAYCVSIFKIKYIFDRNGVFKEVIKMSDEEFNQMLIEDGIDPKKGFKVEVVIED